MESNYKLFFTVPLPDDTALNAKSISWAAGGITLNADLLPYSHFITYNKLIEVSRIRDSKGASLSVKQVFDVIALSDKESKAAGISWETDDRLKEFFEKYQLQPNDLLESILTICTVEDLEGAYKKISSWYSERSTFQLPPWEDFQKRQIHLPLIGYYIGHFLDYNAVLKIAHALRDANSRVKKKLEQAVPTDTSQARSNPYTHLWLRIPAHRRKVAKLSKPNLSLVS